MMTISIVVIINIIPGAANSNSNNNDNNSNLHSHNRGPFDVQQVLC